MTNDELQSVFSGEPMEAPTDSMFCGDWYNQQLTVKLMGAEIVIPAGCYHAESVATANKYALEAALTELQSQYLP